MKKIITIISAVILTICLLATVIPTCVYIARGNIKNEKLPQEFADSLNETIQEKNGDVRIMSSNLLVHYKSWGGLPEKPRAKMYIELLNTAKPDVVGIQELCDGWYCCVKNNLPKGYKMLFSVSTATMVRMTAMVYNSNTLELIESDNFAYVNGDNPRLRRVVWAVFKVKETGKTFAVTNTHFDLLREGRETELAQVMKSQVDELTKCVSNLEKQYNCPVFSVGDFNTMEDTPSTKPIDIPEIYDALAKNFKDTKTITKEKNCDSNEIWEYPSYDHIFLKGNGEINNFYIVSGNNMEKMSDHYPIFIDAEI